jgi:protein-S-isoprenylcysteine O-methyltransferase Ste14
MIMNELTARIILGAVLLGVIAVRVYYNTKSVKAAKESGVSWKESRLNATLRFLLAMSGFAMLGTIIFAPSFLGWARLPLPAWAQWAGAALGIGSVALLWWVQVSLGRNFSGNLHILSDHKLVTFGPYRWVRHPMYTVFYMLVIAFFLLSANALIGVFWIGGLTIVVLSRLNHEEQVMIETFGDEYRAYMSRTGRLLPKFVR